MKKFKFNTIDHLGNVALSALFSSPTLQTLVLVIVRLSLTNQFVLNVENVGQDSEYVGTSIKATFKKNEGKRIEYFQDFLISE